MTLEDIIAEFRRVRQDAQSPYLWSDEEITAYVNDAVNEACERALLIEDRTTSSVCAITLVIGQSSYPLHDAIVKVKRVALDGVVLRETSSEQMDRQDAYWETRTGKPRAYLLESNIGIRFDSKPTSAQTAALTVYRTPLASLIADNQSASPEVKTLYHLRLMPWVYRCALLKQDSEVLTKTKLKNKRLHSLATLGNAPMPMCNASAAISGPLSPR